MISNSEWHVKHLFPGKNTQHLKKNRHWCYLFANIENIGNAIALNITENCTIIKRTERRHHNRGPNTGSLAPGVRQRAKKKEDRNGTRPKRRTDVQVFVYGCLRHSLGRVESYTFFGKLTYSPAEEGGGREEREIEHVCVRVWSPLDQKLTTK